MSYNGWTNYETWSVALIADNDEGTYLLRREIIAENVGADIYDLANVLEEWVLGWPEIDSILGGDGHLASQLLNAALGEVNWVEIAENWRSDENE